VAGHRGFETVVGTCDAVSRLFTETWSSSDLTTGGRYATISGISDHGDCVLVGEGFVRAPHIATIRQGQYRVVRSFGLSEEALQLKRIRPVEGISWKAPDGLDIQGWLLLPPGEGPHPLVMYLHGGPVWHWRPVWLGRGASALMLINQGYAVFLPNPRGSSGRGQAFARRVLGDMGGADTYDLLSGLDHLVERGIADPRRIGVTGGSYGGFMTSWLITQDSRFAAAVSFVPHTNQVTEHLLSNIPHFMTLFLADKYNDPGGKYFERSPVMHAHKVKTPTLNICGALDRVTPPEEAAQFHSALLENNVKSVLVTYPEEGHGVRQLPAVIDYAARVVSWFTEHMPACPL
jgi:dipeptidyl aminopeptidase/acylaminoacyl peptidase